MTLLSCFDCEFSTGSIPDFKQHVWNKHGPSTEDEKRCPECGLPVERENFPYHYPCYFDVDEIDLFVEDIGYLCPLCGVSFETGSRLTTHFDSHSEFEMIEFLGSTRVCGSCGEELTPGHITDHLGCLITGDSRDVDGDHACPTETCGVFAESPGEILWHIWTDHLDEDGISGRCPGCDRKLEFGQLLAHLACLDTFSPVTATQLLPTNTKNCVLCGLSVYSSEVLHRHYHQKHVPSRHSCPGCGAELTEEEGADILNHVLCVAKKEGITPLEGIEEDWYCPICESINSTEAEFEQHLSNAHISMLANELQCHICNKPLEQATDHFQCLVSHGDMENRTVVTPPEVRKHQPAQQHDAQSYFSEHSRFVALEMDAARDEAWEQYESHSLRSLARDRAVVQDLAYVSEQGHPNFDNQLVYQQPENEEHSNNRDLVEEYGIYPGTEVILGGLAGQELPRAAVVTFVDDQSIGFGLRKQDGPVSNRLLKQLQKDDVEYHCVELINPKSFERQKEAINQVKSRSGLRNLVLGSTPVTERPTRLSDALSGPLNEYQTRAVERALGTEGVICIHGPPGTGKTRTLTQLIRIAVAQGKRVLATSHSNQAIDNLIVGSSNMTDPDEDSLHYIGSPSGRQREVPNELETQIEANPDDIDLQETADNLMNRPDELSIARVGFNSSNEVINRLYQQARYGDADVVAGTMSSLSELDSKPQFDLVVVDEAAQASQPASFIPLLRGKQVILAGDHLQLPPYAADEFAKDEDMHESLFEHILNTYDSSISVMLQRQYRMNEAIAEFSSRHVYNGELTTAEQNRTQTIGELKPIMMVDIESEEQTDEANHSKYNPDEADIVAKHVKLLQMQDVPLSNIGVITPYSAQIGVIRSAIQDAIGTTHNLKISTVDSFQGSEREAIIVSFVRSNDGNHSGFLSDPEEGKRRLNVSLTRAKRRLVLIGDWNTLGTPARYEDPDKTCSNLYSLLYQQLNEEGLIKRITPKKL